MTIVNGSDTQYETPQLQAIRTAQARQEILAYCDQALKRAKDGRLPFERQWYMNMAFYFGRQNAQWRTTTVNFNAQLWEPPVPSWRVRIVINKCRRIIRKEMSKVLKERPRGYVMPSSTDEHDTQAARAGELILEHLQRELEIAKVLRRSMFWTLMTGTGFAKDWYDPVTPDSDGIPGKICLEPATPFHIFVPDMQEEELEFQPYVVHVLNKEPGWIKKAFNKDIAPDQNGGASVLDQRFLSALGINEANKGSVAVKEIWIKPCARFKDGAQVIWAGGEILAMQEGLGYAHKQFPFTKFEHIPTGRFYGESSLVDIIPLQKEYNRTASQIIEAKNRMAKPQLLAQRGSIDPKRITSEPGLVILYKPGFQPPTPLPLQNLPAYVTQELDRIQGDMNDVSSQHEISQGQTPPGVTAATAISYLQEEDDSVLATTIASVEEGVERIGRHLLAYVAQFWDAQRTIRVVGENGAFESFVFSKSDLSGNTDFRVESGSGMPVSRAAKQAFILELVDRQLIPPDRALKYLQLAETGKLYEETQLDARQAQRENLKMLEGEEVLVNTWDNHMVHIMEHDSQRKKQEFELADEQVKAYFEQHVQRHKQVLQLSSGQVPGIAPDPMMAMMGPQLPADGPQPNNPESPVGPNQQAGPM